MTQVNIYVTPRRVSAYLLLVLCLLPAVPAIAQTDPYRTQEAILEDFFTLQSSYPAMLTSEVIGATVEGQDIYLFRLGNPAGVPVFIEAALHGHEYITTEALYYCVEWILTEQTDLLDTNYILFVPIVNRDSYGERRTNAAGVDINRNFPTYWQSTGAGTIYYSGPALLSEPETQAIHAALAASQPRWFIDLHAGLAETRITPPSSQSIYNDVYTRIQETSQTLFGVSPFPFDPYQFYEGMARYEGEAQGAYTWELEIAETTPSSTAFFNTVVPRVKAVLLETCREGVSVPAPVSPAFLGLSGYPTSTTQLQHIIDTMDATGLNTYRLSFNPDWFSEKPHPYNASFIQYVLDHSDYMVIADRNHLYPPDESTSSEARDNWVTVRASIFEVLETFPNNSRVAIELINEYVSDDYDTRMQALITEIRAAGYTNGLVVNKWTTAWHKFEDPLNNTYQGYHFYFNTWSLTGATSQLELALSRGIKVINTEIGADSGEASAFTPATVSELNSFLNQCASMGVGNLVWMNTNLDNWPRYRELGLHFPTEPSTPNQLPVADAGPDQTVTDFDSTGDETVLLDGAASYDVDGTIITYEWSEGANVLGTEPSVTTRLPIGAHTVTLHVTDNAGATDTDTVIITVNSVATIEFADSFEVSAWNGGWVEDNQNAWGRSRRQAREGTYSAEVDGRATDATLTLSTPIDLTGKRRAQLSFSWFIERSWDTGEYLCLDMYYNGVWHNGVLGTEASLEGNDDAEDTWHDVRIELSPEQMTHDFKIRFRARVSRSNEDGYVDNVIITSQPYLLTLNTVGQGEVLLNPDGGTYSQGTVVTLTASADPGWTFTGWSGDVTGDVTPAALLMDGDKAVTATFTPNNYTLTVANVGSGSVDMNPNQTTYPYGELVTLTATPDPGWVFTGWSGDLTGDTNPDSITVTGNTSILATFAEAVYTLAVTVVGNGSVDLSSVGPYGFGEVVLVTATPDTGWTFDGWSGGLSGATTPETVIVDGNKTITATFTPKGYTLTLNTVGSGSITADPNQATYHHGDLVTVTATPAVGWSFMGWSGDLASSENPASITIAANTTATATFTQDEYTITLTANGLGSIDASPDQVTYHYGDSVALTAIPDLDWMFVAWSGDLTSSENPASLLITGNTTVTATFTDEKVLTIIIVGGGTVTKHPNQPFYDDGTVVTLTAVADPGWTFTGWSGDVTGDVTPAALLMDGDKAVTAAFTPNNYTLTVANVGSGSVDMNPNQTTYPYGELVTLTATPDPGWVFTGWSGDYAGTENPYEATIMGDISLTATFTSTSVLTVNVVGNGFVNVDPDQFVYPTGTVVTLTAVADPGWTFTGWSGDVTDIVNPTSLTVAGEMIVTATFLPNEYTLTLNTEGSGNITANPDQATYRYGDVVTVTVVVDTGWSFARWSDDLDSSTNPTSLTMDSDKTVTAIFTQDQYILTVNTVGLGTVDAHPDQATYYYNDLVTLSAHPAEGWIFDGWSGALTGSVTPTPITLNEDTTVTAIFTELPPPYRFTDGYESGDFTHWTGTTTVSGSAAVTSSVVYSGTYSGQFAVNSGSSARRAYSHITVGSLTEVYARAYVYIPSDLALSSGQKVFLIQMRDAGGSPVACFGVIADGSGPRWAVQSGNWPYALGTSGPNGSGWHLIEAYFTRAASGPTLILWVDGVEVASLTENTSGANAVTSAWIGITYYTGRAAFTVYVDEVAVD
jgi:uncharacterized repeat protein (TIGR02543 family)